MLERIERLREAPKAVRDRYALGFAAVVTGLLAIVWVATLPVRFQEVVVSGENGEGVTPFASLFETARDQFAAVKNATETDTAPTDGEPSSVREPATTPPLDPNAITLSPEEVAAAASLSNNYTPPATTTQKAIQIVTSSSLTSTSTGGSDIGTQR